MKPFSICCRVLALLVLAVAPACTAGDGLTTSVRPGVNASYYEAESADPWVGRFETESREIWDRRHAIVDAVDVHRGAAVADVGAGTGFFSLLFAERVGVLGRVYAVDLMPYFVEHVHRRAEAEGAWNVVPVLCTERSVALPPGSVDVAFLCDTYHHLEYPRATLASIRRALRPGGQLVLIDFIREPGVSRDWVLDHVRAGRDRVIREIEAAGFRTVETRGDLLDENWFARFRRTLLATSPPMRPGRRRAR